MGVSVSIRQKKSTTDADQWKTKKRACWTEHINRAEMPRDNELPERGHKERPSLK